MNTQALRKCLIELEKGIPNLAYIRGILETVVDANEPIGNSALTYIAPTNGPLVPANTTINNNTIELTDDEREQLELARRYNSGPIAELQ